MNRYSYDEAVRILTDHVSEVSTVTVKTEELYGRILAEDIVSNEDVPAYARSPYDGYAFRASDSKGASKGNPVVLDVIESIRVDQVPFNFVSPGTAIRLVTGSPVPGGADAICKYEDTEFTDNEVTLKREYAPGENIICAGEDIKRGACLARKGTIIDTGLTGTMASLGINRADVYRRVIAGIISTGDEVVDINEALRPGMIRNSNKYTVAAALESIGIDTVYLGHAADDREEISRLILEGANSCDIIISTGGVSAGEYDLVPDAMEAAGYSLLVKGVDIKPGMACAYGIKGGSLMLALSGNPASSLTNLQSICYPALRKLMGISEYDNKTVKLKLKKDCVKKADGTRIIRGRVTIEDGNAMFMPADAQGNVVISSSIGCNAYAVTTGERRVLKAGTLIEGFMTGNGL